MYTRLGQLLISSIFITFIFMLCFSQVVIAQTDWVQLFYDDFEDGFADGWELALGY